MKQHIWILFGIVAAMASCAKDDRIDTPLLSEKDIVKVTMMLTAEESAASRTLDESRIADVNLFLYGANNYHFYYDQNITALDFEVVVGDYRIYVVTNLHQDTGAMSEVELKNYQAEFGSMLDREDIPMTGYREEIISAATSVLDPMSVKRNAAKIEYSISVQGSTSIRLQSVQFCNVPMRQTLFGQNTPSLDVADYTTTDAVALNGVSSYASTAYLFENAQGEVSSISSQQDKSPANAPRYATYLRILAQADEKILEYIIYLGRNNTTDFNLLRNTHHKLNIVIRGESEVDSRVFSYDGLYYGEANCYVVKPGGGVIIDCTPYRTSQKQGYRYTGLYAGDEYRAVKAKILWKDNRWMLLSAYFAKQDLVVQMSGSEVGNAVVAICDSNSNILWSFHIWVTTSVTTRDYAANSLGNAYTVMDRNLGATSRAVGALASYGLLYQWGRKDPFVGASAVNANTDATMWSSSSTSLAFEAQRTVEGSTVASVAQTPQTFYYHNTNWFDGAVDKYLWGNPNDNPSEAIKTVYDPCPKGYRVPPRDWALVFSKNGKLNAGTTQDLSVNNYRTYSTFDCGWRFYTDGIGSDATTVDYYPAAGMRNGYAASGKGALNSVGSQGEYWTSGYRVGDYCYRVYLNTSTISVGGNFQPISAMAVRCVKE